MTSLPSLAALACGAALLAASMSVFSVVVPTVLARAEPLDVAEAETVVCQLRSGRSHDACGAETEGKALIRDAERSLAAAGRPARARAARAR
jgi:hypothetical protein